MTIPPSPLEILEVEAETQRLENWACFVAELRDYAFHDGWAEALTAMTEAHDGFDGTALTAGICSFAQVYGWPDTLRAIAQAMSEDEKAKRELVDRR